MEPVQHAQLALQWPMPADTLGLTAPIRAGAAVVLYACEAQMYIFLSFECLLSPQQRGCLELNPQVPHLLVSLLQAF